MKIWLNSKNKVFTELINKHLFLYRVLSYQNARCSHVNHVYESQPPDRGCVTSVCGFSGQGLSGCKVNTCHNISYMEPFVDLCYFYMCNTGIKFFHMDFCSHYSSLFSLLISYISVPVVYSV